MKIARNTKIICFIMVIALALLGLSFTSFKTIYADEVSSNDYFSITKNDGSTTSTTQLDGTNLVLSLGKDYSAEFKRNLIISDFETSFSMASEFTTLTLTLKYTSADVNGVIKNVDGKDTLDKTVKNDILIQKASNTYNATVCGKQKTIAVTVGQSIKVKSTYTDNKLKVSIAGTEFDVTNDYQPKAIGNNVVATLLIKTNCEDDSVHDLSIEYIDQKVSDTNNLYRQKFILTDGKVADATSIILANDSFYTLNSEGTIVKNLGEKTSISFKEYSVNKSTHSSSDFQIKIDDSQKQNIWFSNGSTKYIAIYSEEACSFNVEVNDKTYATFTVKGEEDSSAPVYDKTFSLDSFKTALFKATRAEYDVVDEATGLTVKKEFYVRLGSSNYLEIPSMESFVSDNTTAYENMSYTVYYRTANSDWTSTSSFKIPLSSIGKYDFFVLFKDKSKNGMEKSDFINDDGEILDEYENYVFSFEVYNDAPISITAGSQEKAYKGIEYTATEFTVLAKDYEVQYTLYYSKTNSDADWTEIPALSSMKESDDDYDTYKDYNYDGSLTFTPVKIGYYKIVASLFEKESTRSDEANIIIEVNSTPKVVKPQSDWAKNNVWSIVFLSVGCLALVGIIVILCIPEKKKDDVK